MTEEHLTALLAAAEAKKDPQGFTVPAEGRLLTLYVSNTGVPLTVSRIEALKLERGLIQAKTTKGEVYVLSLVDVFAGALESAGASTRKAGFA